MTYESQDKFSTPSISNLTYQPQINDTFESHEEFVDKTKNYAHELGFTIRLGKVEYLNSSKKSSSKKLEENSSTNTIEKKIRRFQQQEEIKSLPEFSFAPEPILLPEHSDVQVSDQYTHSSSENSNGIKSAHSLIGINAVIIAVLFTIVLRMRSLSSELMIPVFILLIVSTVTIVFAVRSIRPVTEEEIQEYEKRNRNLIMSYTIFMYGLCVSVLALIIATIMSTR